MPYRKKFRRRFMRRKKKRYPYRKKRKITRYFRNNPNVMRLPAISRMPDKLICKLRYDDSIKLTDVAGFGTYIYRLNSLFDPDFTGTGHQPKLYDQLTAFYDHYEVKASKITVRPQPPDVNPVTLSVYPSHVNTPVLSTNLAREIPYSRTCYVTGTGSVNQQRSYTSNYMTVKKLEGRNPYSVNFTSNTSSNPSITRYWHIIMESKASSPLDISDIPIQITIIYYATFFRRGIITQS